jgi:type IV secretion system protein VirB10
MGRGTRRRLRLPRRRLHIAPATAGRADRLPAGAVTTATAAANGCEAEPGGERAKQEAEAAAKAPVFFAESAAQEASQAPGGGNNGSAPVKGVAMEGNGNGIEPPGYGTEQRNQNAQDQKLKFPNAEDTHGLFLERPLVAPPTPYVVKAGWVIPAALETALNSDSLGEVVARVTETVYDTVSGNFLLIPQGAMLFGRYDPAVSYGQTRAVVRWDRLDLPNGKSIELAGMTGTDATGQAGL